MKDLFKLEAIWLKMPENLRPSKYAMMNFFNGSKLKGMNEHQIKSVKGIVNEAHKNAIAFLNEELKKEKLKQ